MSSRDYVDPTANLYRCFIDEASVNSHCFIARVIRYVFYVEFYTRCDGQTLDEAPTAWNLCRDWHFFHAVGRKKRKRKKKKREKKGKKKGKEKGREERETLFQVRSNSSSRDAKVTDVFRSRCDKKKGTSAFKPFSTASTRSISCLQWHLKPSIQHLWDLAPFDSSD